jgi:HAD superfamily hydrolase (TIGR01509 family)
MPNLLLFDLDGVLIDSKLNMSQSWQEVCNNFNINVPFEQYFKHIGRPFEDIMKILELEHLLPEIKTVYFSLTKKYEDLILFYPNTENTLALLSKKYKLGVVTSKSKTRTIDILSCINVNFLVIKCPEDGKGKPAPDLLISAMQAVNESPKDTVYFGDMPVDLQAANAAGVKFIQCTWGYADIVFSNHYLDSLKNWINN